MGIVTHKHLHCDRCMFALIGTAGAGGSVGQQRIQARTLGWARLRVDAKVYDICHTCRAGRSDNTLRRDLRALKGRSVRISSSF